jgi:uncharacterized protein with HEPN domain
MSKRSKVVYLGVLLDAARRAHAKAEGVTRERYDGDDTLQLALTYLVQNVGEAASKVAAELRLELPEIDWSAITGMRHRIVHDYLNVDLDMVWDALQTDVPELIRHLERLIPPESPAA